MGSVLYMDFCFAFPARRERRSSAKSLKLLDYPLLRMKTLLNYLEHVHNLMIS